VVASVATTVDPRTRRRAQPSPENATRYEPCGAVRDLFLATDPEVLIEGPAGTGKSLGCLKKLHRNAIKYPGSRQLILRKTRVSLTQTAMITFEHNVIVPGGRVRFHTTLQAYLYPNGSIIAVAGLDKDSKVMSSEYDTIYVQEATELIEAEAEALTTRLRHGVIPHQQLIMDCNPGPPTHWLNQRCEQGKTTRLQSRHVHNPTLWDGHDWTPYGADYIAKLDALTGVRYDRLRLGKWVAAEGQIYEGWDTEAHLIDRFDVPPDWPHYWDIDFGFTNPFVWHDWAMDPDGRLYLVDEIYRTQVLVEDHAANILNRTRDRRRPSAIITDHDAEDRATFERKTGYRTQGAIKEVSPGIQAVSSRLRPAQDGRPRLFIFRDACPYGERDRSLIERGKPSCTADEFPTYVWDTRQGLRKGEQPTKEDDHGMDATRYQVMHHEPRRSTTVRGIR
jgi:phage terminase large subunit